MPYTTEIISQPYDPLAEYSTLDLGLGWDDPEEMLPIPFDMVIWGDTCSFLGTANLGEMIVTMSGDVKAAEEARDMEHTDFLSKKIKVNCSG